jgi:hypothetical protein
MLETVPIDAEHKAETEQTARSIYVSALIAWAKLSRKQSSFDVVRS